MTTRKRHVEQMEARHPSYANDYRKNCDKLIEDCLKRLIYVNPDSSSLSCVRQYSNQYFPYIIEEKELIAHCKRISRRFNEQKTGSKWDQYKDKLPKLFKETQDKQISKVSIADFTQHTTITKQDPVKIKYDDLEKNIVNITYSNVDDKDKQIIFDHTTELVKMLNSGHYDQR